MTDAKKDALRDSAARNTASKAGLKAALIGGVQMALANPSIPSLGLPPGVLVSVNSTRVARFPIPLTVGSSVGVALGAIAMMRGHRVVGFLLLALGGAGIGAAAAAPEIGAALAKMRNP